MFYNTKVKVYDYPGSTLIKTIYADLQPYSATLNLDYGLSLEISHRLFCDYIKDIGANSYLKIDCDYYKVMDIKTWSDYLEIYLYKCQR